MSQTPVTAEEHHLEGHGEVVISSTGQGPSAPARSSGNRQVCVPRREGGPVPQVGLVKVALNRDLLPHMDFTNVDFLVNLKESENDQREAINCAPSKGRAQSSRSS